MDVDRVAQVIDLVWGDHPELETVGDIRDAIHAAGIVLPTDLTPPSERPVEVPNRATRREKKAAG